MSCLRVATIASSTTTGPARTSIQRCIGTGPRSRTTRRSSMACRSAAPAGSITSVWSWTRQVTAVGVRDGILVIHRGDQERHEHARTAHGWSVTIRAGNARSSIDLGGLRPIAHSSPRAYRADPRPRERHLHPNGEPLRFTLGETAYRQSEETWDEAGGPRATVTIEASQTDLAIRVEVQKRDVAIRSPGAADPALDNEHPDIHSDGVQLYVAATGWDRPAAWLAVPEYPEPRVRSRVVDGARRNIPLAVGWNAEPRGYAMRFEIPLDALGAGRHVALAMDLIVNEMARSRV